MKYIIIFGGAGFIGTNLTKYLLKDKNNYIICVDNLCTGSINNVFMFDQYKNYDFYEFDIINDKIYNLIESKYNKIDEIYNLACPASPPKYLINPIHTINSSLAIQNICKLAIKYNAKLLQASTSEVYGNPDLLHHPQNEYYNGNVNMIGPRSCYDEGKRIAETILYEYYKIGCKSKIVRIFNTYGPYMDPNDGRVISNFICQSLLNKNITIYGNGLQTRSFQYIDDLIIGLVEFMKTDEFGPVNIGNPEEFTINELVKIIKQMLPKSLSKIEYKELPKDDPIQRKADITRAHVMFGYEPKIKLKEGLQKTIEYFKNKLNSNV